MGYLKRFKDSYRFGRCSSINRVRYTPMSEVQVSLATSSQLTTFSLWYRVESFTHPTGLFIVTSPMPP